MVVWNTPAPPLGLYEPAEFNSSYLRHVVNLEEVRGLTFFFNVSRVMGIHVHDSAASCAMDTAKGIFDLKVDMEWIYLPLCRDDPPIAFGTRTTWAGDVNILVRTQRTGGVILGRHYYSGAPLRDYVLAAGRPISIIYGEPDPGQPLRLLGAHPGLSLLAEYPAAPFSMAYPQPNPINYSCLNYFSWAPLANVSSTVTFYDEASGRCRGIIFHYEGGGARAVGECRLHVDRAERVDRPARLCFWTETVPTRPHCVSHRVWARFEQHPPSKPANEPDQLPGGWVAWPMRGIVKFWFERLTSFMAVEDCPIR